MVGFDLFDWAVPDGAYSVGFTASLYALAGDDAAPVLLVLTAGVAFVVLGALVSGTLRVHLTRGDDVPAR